MSLAVPILFSFSPPRDFVSRAFSPCTSSSSSSSSSGSFLLTSLVFLLGSSPDAPIALFRYGGGSFTPVARGLPRKDERTISRTTASEAKRAQLACAQEIVLPVLKPRRNRKSCHPWFLTSFARAFFPPRVFFLSSSSCAYVRVHWVSFFFFKFLLLLFADEYLLRSLPSMTSLRTLRNRFYSALWTLNIDSRANLTLILLVTWTMIFFFKWCCKCDFWNFDL